MLIPAARAGKLFGDDGGLTLTLYPLFPEDFTAEIPLFARIDGLDVPLWCERFERRGVTGAVVRFADFDTARRAAELTGKELYIEQAEEENDDEFYLEDLIGFRASGFEGIPCPDERCGTSVSPALFPRTGAAAAADAIPTERANTPSPDLPAETAWPSGRNATETASAADVSATAGMCDSGTVSPAEGARSACAGPHRFTGEVTDYYDSESNPLLEITTDDGAEILVPAAEEFIARIDFEARTIEFVLPEGLMHLNRK